MQALDKSYDALCVFLDRMLILRNTSLQQIVEPSKEVALQLLESGRQNSHTRKLGLEMLRQLAFHHDYVQSLAQDGYYIEALRYARKHKVIVSALTRICLDVP